jgi:hypothetical protein
VAASEEEEEASVGLGKQMRMTKCQADACEQKFELWGGSTRGRKKEVGR